MAKYDNAKPSCTPFIYFAYIQKDSMACLIDERHHNTTKNDAINKNVFLIAGNQAKAVGQVIPVYREIMTREFWITKTLDSSFCSVEMPCMWVRHCDIMRWVSFQTPTLFRLNPPNNLLHRRSVAGNSSGS